MTNYLIFGLMVLNALLMRRVMQSWLAPPAFCAIYWCAYTLLNLATPMYPIDPLGLAYIGLVMAVFGFGHLLGERILPGNEPTRGQVAKIEMPPLNYIMAFCAVLGLLFPILAQLLRIELAGGSDSETPRYFSLFVSCHFLGPLIAGIGWALTDSRKCNRVIAMSTLSGPLLTSILYTGRTAFLGPLILLITSYLAGMLAKSAGKVKLVTVKAAVYMVAGFLLLSLFGKVIYAMRIGREFTYDTTFAATLGGFVESINPENMAASSARIDGHIYGQVYAFSEMFRSYYLSSEFVPSNGMFMFAGPLLLLDIPRPPLPDFKDADTGFYGNVYTIFPAPLQDFGVWGSLVCWLLLGIISGVAFVAAKRGSVRGMGIVLLILMNLQMSSCFIFRYNGVILFYVLAFVFCAWCDKWSRHAIRGLAGTPGRASFPDARVVVIAPRPHSTPKV